MIAECYDLTVQCDEFHLGSRGASFNGPNRRYCWKLAKLAGWVLRKDGAAFCPHCVRFGRHKTPKDGELK